MNKETITDKEYIGVKDKKARRRVNVSSKQANITASEIESGVTLETLQSLNVPVFQSGITRKKYLILLGGIWKCW